jgi:uncharacterized protein
MKGLFAFAASLLLSSQSALAQEPVFDTHVHLWKGETSLRAYQEQSKAAGVQTAGFAGMWFGGPNQALEGDIQGTRRSNDELIALAARHPEMLPVATVHPYDGNAAMTELQRVAARGVKVLKIHPHTQKFDAADPRVRALVRQAGDLGMVVLMDNANILPGDSEELFNLALQAPKTKFIFAHMGGLNFRFWNILKLARTAEDLFANNIYFDISGLLTLAADSPIEEEFVWTMRNVGIDQLLLGSDYPQLSLPDAVQALDRLGLSGTEKAKIRYHNARKLFGLAP